MPVDLEAKFAELEQRLSAAESRAERAEQRADEQEKRADNLLERARQLKQEQESAPKRAAEREAANVQTIKAKIEAIDAEIEKTKRLAGRDDMAWRRHSDFSLPIGRLQKERAKFVEMLDKRLPTSDFGDVRDVKDSVLRAKYQQAVDGVRKMRREVERNPGMRPALDRLDEWSDKLEDVRRKIRDKENVNLPGAEDL